MLKNIPVYDKYRIKNGKVKVTEYGYCPGNSVTDNPEDICRIVKVRAEEFLKSDENGYQITLQDSKQHIEDCTEKRYLERLEELKQSSVLRSIYDVMDAPDGEYISIDE